MDRSGHRAGYPTPVREVTLGGPPAYRAGRRPVVIYSDLPPSPLRGVVSTAAANGKSSPRRGVAELPPLSQMTLTAPLQTYIRDVLRKLILPNGEPLPPKSVIEGHAGGVADTRERIAGRRINVPAHIEKDVMQFDSPLAPATFLRATSCCDLTKTPSRLQLTTSVTPTPAPRDILSGLRDGWIDPARAQELALSDLHAMTASSLPKLPSRVEELALPHKKRRVVRARMEPGDVRSPDRLPETLQMIHTNNVYQTKEAKREEERRNTSAAREGLVQDALAHHDATLSPPRKAINSAMDVIPVSLTSAKTTGLSFALANHEESAAAALRKLTDPSRRRAYRRVGGNGGRDDGTPTESSLGATVSRLGVGSVPPTPANRHVTHLTHHHDTSMKVEPRTVVLSPFHAHETHPVRHGGGTSPHTSPLLHQTHSQAVLGIYTPALPAASK
jgi:hypothetical protein